MRAITKALRILLLFVAVVLIAWIIASNYSFIFSKVVKGEILEVERVTQPTAVIGSTVTPEQLYSFAVMIRSESGEIFSASSEDRQWAIAKKGYCVEARFYPYPPWNFDKADTYFNARLVKVLGECKAAAPVSATPAQVTPTPPAPGSPSGSTGN
jgi:hypothetical protein